MSEEMAQVLRQLIAQLEDAFKELNAANSEFKALRIIVNTINTLEKIASAQSVTFRSKRAEEFTRDNEEFVRETLDAFNARNLSVLMHITDDTGDNCITAGSAPVKGAIQALVIYMVTNPEILKGVLDMLGFPSYMAEKMTAINIEAFERFKQKQGGDIGQSTGDPP